MAKRVRVLVADDDRLFRELLEKALSSAYDVLPGASTLQELDAAFAQGGFEVAVIDLSWGAEGSVTPRLRRWHRRLPAVRVILLTALDDWYVGHTLLREGASGYLGKHSDLAEVLEAIEAALRGERYMGRQVVPPPREPAPRGGERLPPETLRVLRPLAEGWSRKQIASILHLHVKTIDYHITRIKAYFGVVGVKQPNWRRLLTTRRGGTEGQP